MNESENDKSIVTHLPDEPIDAYLKPISRFLRIEAAGGAVLFLFSVFAIIISNSPFAPSFSELWSLRIGFDIGSFEFARSLKGWINDGLMTVFFFLVALELKREFVLGELNQPRRAAFSIVAALGGMLVPALLYLILQYDQAGEAGWGTVMATDTAFVVGCLALLGSSRIPHDFRVFMLSLAIVDDVGAIIVVTLGYSDSIAWGAIALAALGVTAVRIMALIGVRGLSFYILAGVCIWLAVDASGIHATITGVTLGLMTPARRWVSDDRLYAILDGVIAHPAEDQDSHDTKDRQTLRLAEEAVRETLSPVERLEMVLHPWVGFVILPLFAFANAGVPLNLDSFSLADLTAVPSITLAIFIGFTVGKPLGVLIFCWLGVRAGIAIRPVDISWRLLAGGGVLAGIGFTMALFIAQLGFDESNLNSAKYGILLASLVSALAGMALLWLFTERRSNSTTA